MHVLGLRKAPASSFWAILRNQSYIYPVTKEFLTSSSFKLINPRGHRIATDQVAMRLPSSSISDLNDEAVLALFTRGFFGGKVFCIERFILKVGLAKIMPARYTGFTSLPTEKIEWNPQNISTSTVIPVGDILFGSFKLVDSHIKQTPRPESESDPLPSYLDFGFGSDTASFGGCHRFSVHRDLRGNSDLDTKSSPTVTDKDSRQVQDEVEIRIEHFSFICNPWTNVDSWPKYMTWFHRWYERLLFTDGIRSVLRQ
ncbi:hypothetical protein BDP27DRAFT_1424341 [Rhodocollybia butyracea]|uniref:Uncharacterized protein n=1 Tax=Rhodocollybia butyracea TaxID=206335 RepID=A0A9P5PL95_9AGAR|nr:hypothetical protein BDP27DRAFT_1424341 [Rhodocollybia butyracea]